MTSLSTAAWIAHTLGPAAVFGGNLFGRTEFSRNLDAIGSEEERGKMLNQARNRYNVVSAVSVGTAAVTWFRREFLRGRRVCLRVMIPYDPRPAILLGVQRSQLGRGGCS